MAKLDTVVVGVVLCQLLVVGSAAVGAPQSLPVLVTARRGRVFPLLPVTLAGFLLFLSEM
jgi:hypothetical protein